MSAEQATLKRLQEAEFLLRRALAPVVAQRMQARFGAGWRMYASRAQGADPRAELDLYALLKTLIANWNDAFAGDFKPHVRSCAYVAQEGRNAVAHANGAIPHEDALRFLDAHRRLLEALKSPDTAKVRALYQAEAKALAGVSGEAAPAPPPAPAAAQQALGLDAAPAGRLTPWREVAFPRLDVVESRFQDAEYAADLSAVDRGVAPEEYGTPAGFFRMTHPTVGLKRVLRSAYDRLTDAGGDPVIGLQTAFGGGKTHTLLALYHMAGAERLKDLPVVGELAAAEAVWTPARRAVFVGYAVGPDMPFTLPDGRRLRTLWGWLAERLLPNEGLALVAEAEAAGTSPGAVALEAVLRRAAPCVVLLDEIVAYVRQLDEQRFESHLTFFQELTEAAKNVPRALVVGSLPESDAEAGGSKGQEALRRLEKIFGRIQSPWLPASGVETYEIVRRRLFEPLDAQGEKVREATIKAFADLYRRNRADFPAHAAEAAYLDEMRACYPIHPELLSRLAKDWSGLEKFQRTRGVLKLMAHVIATLWREERDDAMLLPGRVPLHDERVRAGLLVPIDPAYGAVLDREVVGASALPAQMEATPSRNIARARAATRVARALFVCSVPSASQPNRGITGQEIRLACAEPGDQLDVFGNALREFGERAVFLYEEAGRYWFSPQPTLNKLAEDRARAYSDDEVDADIVRMLGEEAKSRGGFARVHPPKFDPTDADDAVDLGLVILGPAWPHAGRGIGDSAATEAVADVLLRRGGAQRRYRNTLVFLAADLGALELARSAVRKALAWESIVRDAEGGLELTASQRRDAADKAKTGRQGALQAMRAAWAHGLFPVKAEGDPGGVPFALEHVTIRAGDKPLPQAAYEKFERDGTIMRALGPDSLWLHLAPLWPAEADHLSAAQVAEWFASYVYLPRLRDRVALAGAIEAAVARTDAPFALARLAGGGSGYRDIALRRAVTVSFDPDVVLLRREAAERLTATVIGPGGRTSQQGTGTGTGDTDTGDILTPPSPPPEPEPAAPPRRFYGSIELDPNRPMAKLGSIVDGVLSELTRPSGAKVRLVLEIHAEAPEGFSEDVVSVVRDNAKTLGFDPDGTGFERE